MAGKMSDVQRTIERGGLWQQIGAITLLRLTPVVRGAPGCCSSCCPWAAEALRRASPECPPLHLAQRESRSSHPQLPL